MQKNVLWLLFWGQLCGLLTPAYALTCREAFQIVAAKSKGVAVGAYKGVKKFGQEVSEDGPIRFLLRDAKPGA